MNTPAPAHSTSAGSTRRRTVSVYACAACSRGTMRASFGASHTAWRSAMIWLGCIAGAASDVAITIGRLHVVVAASCVGPNAKKKRRRLLGEAELETCPRAARRAGFA